MLLAAGRGARLRPLTDDCPKCLLEVGGTALIVRAVEILAAHGLSRFTVVDGYLGDRVRSALTSRFPAEWFEFVRNDAWDETNNAYSLWLARAAADEPLLLLDGDVVFAPEVIGLLLGDPRPNRLALRARGDLGDEEMKVGLGPGGVVDDVGKGIPPSRAGGESIGIEAFSADCTRRLFATLDRRVREGPGRSEFYESTFVELIRAGEVVHAVDVGDLDCIEIDTAEDLARARARFAPRR